MILFPDQNQFTYELATSLSQHRKTLGQAATGFGKTVVFSNISHRWINKNDSAVLIFVHREELLEQTRKTLYNEFGIQAIPIVAGMKYIPPAKVYVGMVESAFKRLHKISNIGLVIIDEAHRAEFNKVHDEFKEAKIIGFSATPVSSNKKKPLKLFYEDIVCGPQIKELIALRRLSQNVTYSPPENVDRNLLTVKGNDFDEEVMSFHFRKSKHINNTIAEYQRRGVGLKTVIFNVNIQHSKDVCKAFNDAGYECKHLGSDVSKEERREILKWLKNNPKAIVSNVGIATTGLDEPSIEHIIFNKATLSLSLWLQCCGRGGRITKLKSMFYITDMGNNWKTLGDWSDDRDWKDLFFYPEKAKKPNVAPIRSCPNCDAIIPASATKCKWCGYEIPKKPVAEEEKMKEFVIVTKDINIQEIINTNEDKREYFTFFEIGRLIAVAFKEKSIELNETSFNFALTTYYNLAKKWTHDRKRKFNEFHRNLARTELLRLFKIDNPEWLPPPQQ